MDKLQLQGDAEIALWSAVYVKSLEGNLRLRAARMIAPSKEQADLVSPNYLDADALADAAVKLLRQRRSPS